MIRFAMMSLVIRACLAAGAAQATLPPEWQRVRELVRVIEAAAKVLEGRPIDSVEHVEDGLYRAKAGPCSVDVRVVDQPGTMPGPKPFSAFAEKPKCS